MRYTRADLDKDLRDINHKLWILNARHRLVTERRNGYVAVDLTKDTMTFPSGGCDQRVAITGTLVTGTPRECLAAANAYVVRHVKGPELALARHA